MVKAHKDAPPLGFCKLCARRADLVESHVHSRLAYKRYAMNPRGGAFIDLAERRRHNFQLQRRWFCAECEGRFEESATARWLDKLQIASGPAISYDAFLKTFAVSLVYRYALLDPEDGKPPLVNLRMLTKPVEVWRDYLLRRRKDVGVYTVHGIIVPDDAKNGPWEAALGGQIVYCNELIITRTGPLVIFGLMSKKNLSPVEVRQWSETEISSAGGNLPIVRKSDNFWALTPEMCQALNTTGRWCIQQQIVINKARQ
jgi:hypothetical protein